jgi:phage terminase large subunit-like protein
MEQNAMQMMSRTVCDVSPAAHTSWLTLKSYDQKRLSFQGTGKHVIWLDEEPDLGVYSECLLRTMTTNGLVMCTFTPMLGLSEVVMNYLPEGRIPL